MRIVWRPRLTLVLKGEEQGFGLRPSSLQLKLERSVERKRTLARFSGLAASGSTSRMVLGRCVSGGVQALTGQRKPDWARFQWSAR